MIMHPREVVHRLAADKIASVKGGGKDFEGALLRLVGMWSDPAHALIELVQNADDAEAAKVVCNITSAGVRVSHDGMPFTADDVADLCSVDSSHKDTERQTGFMGIGFKAVFKLSNEPHVISPPWQFKFSPGPFDDRTDPGPIGWILAPRWLQELPNEVETFGGTTTIWLPYKDTLDQSFLERLRKDILDRFDPPCLLFLRHIRTLELQVAGRAMRFLTAKRRGKHAIVVEGRDAKTVDHHFWQGSRVFDVPDVLRREALASGTRREHASRREVTVLIASDAKSNLQAAREKFPLYTFLPTGYYPGVPFIIQADFVLDSSRRGLDPTLQWNAWLLQRAADIVTSLIEEDFKPDAARMYQFPKILPSKREKDWEHDPLLLENFLRPLWSYLQANDTVPISQNGWARPDATVIAAADVQNVVDTATLKEVTQRQHFVHPHTEGVQTLRTLGTIDFPEERIALFLTRDAWTRNRHISWYLCLYRLLDDRIFIRHSWNSAWELANRAALWKIVLTAKSQVVSAEDALSPPKDDREGALAARLPDIALVHPEILTKEGNEFLGRLRVKAFSAATAAQQLLKTFESEQWKEWTADEFSATHDLLKQWLQEANWTPTSDAKARVAYVRLKLADGKYIAARDLYFEDATLRQLLPTANFILPENETDEKYYAALGVENKPRVIIYKGRFARFAQEGVPGFPEYWGWLQERGLPNSTQVHSVLDPVRLDLDLTTLDDERAALLLKYFLNHWVDYYQPLLEGRIAGYYRSPFIAPIPSLFAWQLTSAAWLPTTEGLQQPCSSIYLPTPLLRRLGDKYICFLKVRAGGLAKEFADALHLRTTPDTPALLDILRTIQSARPKEIPYEQLSLIYKHLGRNLEEEAEGEVKLDLLCDDEQFRPSMQLYWSDDPEYAAQLDLRSQLAWLPDDVERAVVRLLFERAGVRPLSAYLQRRVIKPDSSKFDESTTRMVAIRADYIHSILAHHGAEDAAAAQAELRQVRVFRADRIEIMLSVAEHERVIQAPAYLDREDRTLYISAQADTNDIAFEVARAFTLDLAFVDAVSMALNAAESRLREHLHRRGIPLIMKTEDTPDEEPLYQLAQLPTRPLRADLTDDADSNELRVSRKSATPSANRAGEESDSDKPGQVDRGAVPRIGEREQNAPMRHKWASSRPVVRINLSHEERMAVESTNIDMIVAHERVELGRVVEDVRATSCGYDLLSTRPGGSDARHIEVKAASHVQLTQREYETALRDGRLYWLYVVDGRQLYKLQDPTNTCEIQVEEIVQSRWKVVDWSAQASPVELPHVE